MRSDISIVAAVHNDSATLRELCDRIRCALGEGCEIILVDDHSSDDSGSVIAQLGVGAVHLHERTGQNGAILTGLRRATGSVCCVLDADLEDPPEALAQLVAALNDGVTRVAFSTREGPRKVSSRIFRRTMRLIYPTLPDRACLCFAMERSAVADLVRVARHDDYLVAVIGALRLPSRQVVVARGRRPERPSGYPPLRRLRHGLRMMWAAIRLKWRLRAA